jgi:hypothetical protein
MAQLAKVQNGEPSVAQSEGIVVKQLITGTIGPPALNGIGKFLQNLRIQLITV